MSFIAASRANDLDELDRQLEELTARRTRLHLLASKTAQDPSPCVRQPEVSTRARWSATGVHAESGGL